VYGTRFSPRLTGTGTLTGNGKGRGEITLVAGIDRDLSRTNDITRILFDADGFTLDSKLAGQETAEVLNLHENTLETLPIAEFTHPAAGLFTFEDPGAEPLLADLRDMLGILADAFGCAVSVTFTITVDADGTYRINLLECRPSG